MKNKELKDDQVIYIILINSGFYFGRVCYLDKKHAQYVIEKVAKFCPGSPLYINETVASDLPSDFEVIERIEK